MTRETSRLWARTSIVALAGISSESRFLTPFYLHWGWLLQRCAREVRPQAVQPARMRAVREDRDAPAPQRFISTGNGHFASEVLWRDSHAALQLRYFPNPFLSASDFAYQFHPRLQVDADCYSDALDQSSAAIRSASTLHPKQIGIGYPGSRSFHAALAQSSIVTCLFPAECSNFLSSFHSTRSPRLRNKRHRALSAFLRPPFQTAPINFEWPSPSLRTQLPC
ncbi:hypothetical protein B0H11DRAFT_675740 [Mycena galericulata]|nr:hypothetical protein B0H11DRAFT_675740 [Mycena galericulata]